MVEVDQAEESKRDATAQKKMKTNVNKNVVVRERDFKSSMTHGDNVTGIMPVGADEFLTASRDQSLKLWDKFTQGVQYTIETHKPLTCMQRTGEKGELIVCGQGSAVEGEKCGDIIVFGENVKTSLSKQLSIEEWAHADEII